MSQINRYEFDKDQLEVYGVYLGEGVTNIRYFR